MGETAQAERMKEHIRSTLLRLMATKSVDTITVTQLVTEARINRSTFYRYYDSLLTVLGDCISVVAGNADKRIPDADDPEFMEKIRLVIRDSIEGIAQAPELFNLTTRYHAEVGVARHVAILQEHTDYFYEGILDGLEMRFPNILGKRQYIPGLLGAISNAFIRVWYANGRKESPDDIADLIMDAYEGVLRGLGK